MATKSKSPTKKASPAKAKVRAKSSSVSPTGEKNVAGAAQSQLGLAPPMTDASGSNIPAPNLRQPLAKGSEIDSGVRKTTAESLDPALTDPDTAARERVKGRTSDAANRKAGVLHDEVPPDLSAGVKASDGGAVAYPFPPQGDVEVATVDPGSGKGEYMPALEVEDWVVLGEHPLVPDRLVGRRAIVVDAPRFLVPVDKQDETWITVRTRDDVNATLHIPLAAVKAIERGGKSPVVRG